MVKLSIFSQELIDGLSIATRILPARAASPSLEAVRIAAEDDGKITLYGSDGSAAFIWTGEAKVDESGFALIPGKLFAELVRKLPKGDVTLETDEKSATILCGKSRSKLSVITGTYPFVDDAGDGYTFTVAQKALKEMISRVRVCISADQNRLVLTGGLMEVYPNEVRMVSLDGFRLSLNRVPGTYILPKDQEKVTAVIPGSVLTEMEKILSTTDDDCIITTNKYRAEFHIGNVEIRSALLTGSFVEYDKILPAEFKTSVLVNRQAAQDAVARAELMAREGKNNLIRMTFSGNTATISSAAENGEVNEEMDVEVQGEPIKIAFNSRYLTEMLRSVDDETMTWGMNTPVSPCVITPKDGGWVHMLLPVRTF